MFDSFGLGAYQRPMYDSAAGNAAEQLAEKVSPVSERAALAAIQSMRSNALSIVLLLTDAVVDNSLEEGSIPSEYLDTLILAAMDSDDDAELDPMIAQLMWANISDAMASLGVEESLIEDIGSDEIEAADAAIEAAAEIIIANMPDTGEPLDEFFEQFVYGFDANDMFAEEAPENGFDAMKKPRVGANTTKTDASGREIRYKGVKVVRNGKIKVVNKRLAGQKVMKSAKQKMALNKLHNKKRSFSSFQKMSRSLRVGVKANIYKGDRAAHAARAMKGSTTGMMRRLDGG